MSEIDFDPQLKRKKRKGRHRKGIGYVVLFAVVFFLALFGMSYAVKSLSPDVDVSIGNGESLTLSDSDIDMEVKKIDERLKWIQMEDELPSVSVRIPKEKSDDKSNHSLSDKKKESKNDNDNKIAKENQKNKEKNNDSEKDSKQKIDFRITKNDSKPSYANKVSKVYIGKYETIEDAVKVQHKVSTEETDIVPFIKAIDGKYVVQIGSFSDSQRAESLVSKMRTKGYPAKVSVER